jgi:xanthine dehydrogenase accessory factor
MQTDSEYKENFPSLGPDCFVVIVTRSHVIDHDVLKRALEQDCAYIGMIGSKAKVAKLFASLKESGVDSSKLDKVFAPIGMHIKGEGPFEIAVSILAELIAVKNGIIPAKS